MIDRRTALAGVAAMFGAQLFAPIARAAAAQVRSKLPVISEGPPTTQVFTAAQRATMSALSDRVIPTTDTPGAVAAGVPAYIEKLLADWSLPGDRVPIVAGLDALDKRSMADNRVPAARATPAQQDALLTLAMDGKIENGKDFFEAFRQLVIAGYYTSEIGMTQEREYLPVPGEYNGEFLYSKVNKVYSA
jgi:gluconate 2-dehydrogenase gamma chain